MSTTPGPFIKEVYITNSNLHFLPSEVFDFFCNLEKLDVGGQNLKEIKRNTFIRAKSLKFLYLHSSQITNLETDCFNGCSNLEVLILHRNQLEFIEQGAFNGMPNLRELPLSFNKIKENMFDQLPNLKKIWLNNNQIESISENLFKFNLKLEEVHLAGNQINSMSHKTFSKLQNLNRLDLRLNKCAYEEWSSNAYQSMKEIEAKLRMCDSVFPPLSSYVPYFPIISTTSTNSDEETSKIVENLRSEIADTKNRFATWLMNLEAKVNFGTKELSNLKETNSNLRTEQQNVAG